MVVKSLPKQVLGPLLKARKAYLFRLSLFSLEKRSGSKTSGFSKYVSSICNPYAETIVGVPFLIETVEPLLDVNV